ncbi:MAG TPA: cupin-like domain-containing protein [Acidimicrobiales bacterium]|nr:cupin-like domain-containing protein [Acidimicrobiales bacterium]
MGATVPTLVEVLVARGVDPFEAAAEVREADQHPYVFGARDVQAQRAKLASVLRAQQQVAALSGHAGEIECRPTIAADLFLERYYCRNQPLVLTDMLNDWPAMAHWGPAYFKKVAGDAIVEVQQGRASDPLYERNLDHHRTSMALSDYVDLVTSVGESNDCYMVANNKNLDPGGPLEVLLDDIVQFPGLLDPAKAKGQVFLWYGPAGTVTPLHHDVANILLCQVTGRKAIRLISPSQTPLLYNDIGVFSAVDAAAPDLDRFPSYREVQPVEFVLEPGEVLFIPVGWWHTVRSLEPSISVSFTNFAFPNTFEWTHPTREQ